MKLLRISHLGIASPTLQEAMERLDKIYGISWPMRSGRASKW